jgi:NAD(P)-dependent dehydrogenase (short-subunit alcohol dehydrogenase family)
MNSSTNSTSRELKDKVFLLSGGTSGVGKAIAVGLAKMGAKVVIISRTAEGWQQGVRQLAEATGNDRAEYLVADLSLQASIRNASEEFKRRYDNLHVLANVAGALFFEKQLTAEGIDKAFAVNYLGHFYLTNQLLDILKASGPARVMTVGGAPRFLQHPTLDLQDIQLAKNYSGMRATSQAMFARIYFTFALAKRLEGTGVTAVAFHPGLITSQLVQDAPWWLKALTVLLKPWEKDTCDVGVYLATAPEAAQANGVFFDDKMQVVPLNNRYDPLLGEKLWHLSEDLTGLPRG